METSTFLKKTDELFAYIEQGLSIEKIIKRYEIDKKASIESINIVYYDSSVDQLGDFSEDIAKKIRSIMENEESQPACVAIRHDNDGKKIATIYLSEILKQEHMKDKKNMDLVHEFGHIFMEHVGVFGNSNLNEDKEIEKEIDLFESYYYSAEFQLKSFQNIKE